MKNTLKALIAVASIAGATLAQAVSIPTSGSVDLSETPYSASGGGEFLAEVAGYDSFYTFCVQRYETLTSELPGTFDYTISDTTSTGSHPSSIPNNTLKEGTTYLYRMFVAGTLYDLTDAVSRTANSISLQKAIWELQGVGAGLGQHSGNNTFLAMVYGLFGEAGAKATTSDATVKVMRIWGPQGEDLQDVLVYVPDSGATLALLGLGLAGLAFARRRR
ncbi:VPDSG-CTERM sorting domain-containing protein [Pelagicoccus sp. SDUM812005]|uniref:VPDSG-CTERM sorting domain-containing protein n=1 Tax=Pelagicoccus sp. SDUM812005 TaxID=3041257 RepID=UPI00280ED8D2|nr:VPDSG-CTERM sorting domain-containing protein [Pelagicoccus sp. SDUM812005]MDQ8183723.1 VPDSG-CTERM sorting domain-containing protein [Pelagicoccus sp. SDUM812005]